MSETTPATFLRPDHIPTQGAKSTYILETHSRIWDADRRWFFHVWLSCSGSDSPINYNNRRRDAPDGGGGGREEEHSF